MTPRGFTSAADDKEMRMLLRKAAGTSSLMRLIGEGGEDELVLIKELQEDKIHDKILHIDFVEVKRGEDLQTTVPLSLIGEAEGVKTEGGILEVVANDIEIRCRPSKLPSTIDLDISNLGLSENLQVKDLPVIDGVEYTSSEDTILVSFKEPRFAISPGQSVVFYQNNICLGGALIEYPQN